jgi:hypothetical protein
MAMPSVDYLAILKTLRRHGVDFVIVGGVCAVLHGAPIATFDLDVVHSREPNNLARLMAALEELDARHRIPGRREKRPGPSHLAPRDRLTCHSERSEESRSESRGLASHQLLTTCFGPLDLLGTIGKGRDYGQLLDEAVELEIGGGLKVRVSTLASLVKTKEETGQEKDRAVLPVLRRLLEEKTRQT